MKNVDSSRILLCLLLPVILASCTKQPFADFTYEPAENPEVGEKIKFENLSVDAENYSWSFSDGQTSTEMSPEMKFNATGTYQVTLEALTKKKSDAYTEEIRIWPKTILEIYAFEPDGSTPLRSAKVSIFDTSTGEPSSSTQIYAGFTDNEGKATIYYLDQKTYYATVEKYTGNWTMAMGGNVTIRQMNDVNQYYGITQLFSNAK